MTRFEEFKSMDIDELTEWICKYGKLNGSPWMTRWDDNYCKKCESIEMSQVEYRKIFGCSSYSSTMTCAYCEVKGKCKFFPEMDGVPSVKDIVKMWLESEVK